MKTTTRNIRRTPRPLPQHPALNPHVYSLMTIPFPVFFTSEEGKVVPTITVPEFEQLVKKGSRFQE